MATQKPTPEERLFAVIQGAAHKPLRPQAQAASLAGLGAQVKARLATLDLVWLNRLILWVVILMGAVCAISPLVWRPRIDRLLAQANQELAPFVIAPPLEGLQPPGTYAELMRTQDPFRLEALGAPVPGATADAPPPPVDPRALLADFRLVGIGWNPDPHVMVEELSQQETHVLRPGERLGEFTVKAILEDRVILELDEQEVELF